jgi:arylsulfatase A-like enzyme
MDAEQGAVRQQSVGLQDLMPTMLDATVVDAPDTV